MGCSRERRAALYAGLSRGRLGPAGQRQRFVAVWSAPLRGPEWKTVAPLRACLLL